MLRNSFSFIEERAQKHGPIFRTRLVGRPTAIITGPEAARLFIDEDRVSRSGAMLPHVQALFGGLSLPVMDGTAHHARKEVVMAAFTADALQSYLPTMQRLVDACLQRAAAREESRMVPMLKRLGIEILCQAVLGLRPGPVIDELLEDYARIVRGLVSLPLPLPGTPFSRAKQALERALTLHRANIDQHVHAVGTFQDDGVTRMLAARAQGGDVTLEALAVENHHLLVAGMIVWSWLAAGLVALDRHPQLRARLGEEVNRLVPTGPLEAAALDAMPYLKQVVDEIRRHTPVLQLAWGRARRTFTFGGYTVPENWMVLWGVSASHMRPEIYPHPDRFDPDRFSAERAEHRRHACAFVPNGAGERLGHLCAGYELAPLLLSVFLVQLLRSFTWEIPRDQRLDYDFSQVPPEPRDGLRVRLRTR